MTAAQFADSYLPSQHSRKVHDGLQRVPPVIAFLAVLKVCLKHLTSTCMYVCVCMCMCVLKLTYAGFKQGCVTSYKTVHISAQCKMR